MAIWSEVQCSDLIVSRRSDAEFFRNDYIDTIHSVRTVGSKRIFNFSVKVVSGPFGSTLKSHEYLSEGVPFIRIIDLKNFFISSDQLAYISNASNSKIKGSELRQGDLILSKVGNSIGLVSILDCEYPIANISENNIGIKFKETHGDAFKKFVLVYLNSKYGQNEILRRSGNAQPKLNVSDIYDIEVPVFSDCYMTEIAKAIDKAESLIKESKKLYTHAKILLESELGLDKLQFDKPLGYVAKLSESVFSGRFDSDYFQVPYRIIKSHLDSLQTVPLFKLVDIVKGIEVGSNAYTPVGVPFLRVSNVKEKGIDLGASDKYISNHLYNNLLNYQPKEGELLLTKDGSAGICFALDEQVTGIISGGIVRLLPRGDVPNEYLALVINSKACRMQVEQECSGALILHWKPAAIRKLRIPLLSNHKMQEIADLVTKSKQANRESDQLLQQAKTRVEQLIEAAVKA